MQALLLDPQQGFTTVINAQERLRQNVLFPLMKLNQPESAQNIQPEIQPEVRVVQLLIQDRRTTSSKINVAQRVNLIVIDNLECQGNEWRASGVEIFKQLQISLGRLDGSGILGIPDRLNPEYTEYFVTFNVEERTETFATTLTNLIIPEGNRLEIRVDDSGGNKQPQIGFPAPHSDHHTTVSSTSATRILAVAKSETFPAEGVSWLQAKIEKRTGYTNFHSNRGEVLQNADRVQFWKFVTEVDATFHKTSWPAQVASAKQKALGIASTSLNEAVTMTRIIDTYTSDGPNRCEQVIAEAWAKDHPVMHYILGLPRPTPCLGLVGRGWSKVDRPLVDLNFKPILTNSY
ncbi:hypothetical protein B0H13DRAFT_2355520 [Mycena leptocephala]|nr:hypothetical protein B0H13DRAFT_2355520 [Mycena leptocephala]